MPTVTDSELKEIKDLIIEIKINQARMDEKLESISENMADLRKQSEKQDNRLWVLISGMFLALLGFVIKSSVNP
jgi:FKBP-type peptidyl-prolyl cis-trans isomerase (trigger factor)